MHQKRIDDISKWLSEIKPGWPFFIGEINSRIAELTQQLINNDCEQTRGRIKALLAIKELPETLQSEREGMESALSPKDADI
jgi:hypothetical protein